MKLDQLHQTMRDLYVPVLRKLIADPAYRTSSEYAEEGAVVDEALNRCPGVEYCEQCSDVFCPYGEPLHFHHDGCPCCSFDAMNPHEDTALRWQRLLTRNTADAPGS